MKRFEYKQLHDRPFITIADPKAFGEWMMKTLNKWGAEGWLVLQVTTPQVNNQLTGDLMALGCRELPPAAPVQQLPEDIPTLRSS